MKKMTTAEASDLIVACGKLVKVLDGLNDDIRRMLVLNQPNETLLKMHLSANDLLKSDTQYFVQCLEEASDKAGWYYRWVAKLYLKKIIKKSMLAQQGLYILKKKFNF